MKLLRNISIKNKLTIIIFSIAFLAILFGFAANIIREYASLKEKMVNEAMMNAKLVGDYCITPLLFDYQDEAEPNLAKLETIPAIFNGYVYDVKGNLFASYNRAELITNPPITADDTYSLFDGDWLHISRTIKYNTETIGIIYLRVSTAKLYDGLINHLISMVVIAVVMMIIVYLLAVKMQKFISQPILTLAALTEQISRDVDYSVRVTRSGDDEIGTLYDSFNNMLEQIQLRERQRDKAEEALQRSEERYRRLTENARDMIYRMSLPDGQYEYASPASVDLFGYTPTELYDSPLLIRKAIHPDWQDYFEEQWVRLIIGDMPPSYEYQIIHKLGETRWVYQRNVLIRDDKQRPIAIEGIVTDITERKCVEQSLKETNKSLEEMVYIASHDLQTPLLSMEGFASEVLKNYRDKLDERGVHQLQRIKANTQRMHKLVLSLLDISRLNTVKNPYETFYAGDVMDNVLDDLSLTIEKAGAKVDVEDLPQIYGDKQRIEGVFRRLVTNALTYKGKSIEIGFKAGAYFVKDDGIGIYPDQLEKIFKPGEQLKDIKTEGVGMGLTFCKKVIDQHNGRIWAESEGINKGAAFYFEIETKP